MKKIMNRSYVNIIDIIDVRKSLELGVCTSLCVMWGELKIFLGDPGDAPLKNFEIGSLKCYFLYFVMRIYRILKVTKRYIKYSFWDGLIRD